MGMKSLKRLVLLLPATDDRDDVGRQGDDGVRKGDVEKKFEGIENGLVGLGDGRVSHFGGLTQGQSERQFDGRLNVTTGRAGGGLGGGVAAGEEGGGEAESETESRAAVPRQRIERRRVDVDVLALGAPLEGLADGPGRITARHQEEPISADGAGQDERSDEEPLAALQVEPFGRAGRAVDLSRHRDAQQKAEEALVREMSRDVHPRHDDQPLDDDVSGPQQLGRLLLQRIAAKKRKKKKISDVIIKTITIKILCLPHV